MKITIETILKVAPKYLKVMSARDIVDTAVAQNALITITLGNPPKAPKRAPQTTTEQTEQQPED